MTKVSIIVPVYKAEKYISKCIESLVSQTLRDIEIILVDDGSPDKSGIICDEYAKQDNRIKVIHKQNGGVSSARNRGIDVANGEYILFVDSDDWVESDYAEGLLNVKTQKPDSEVLCGYRTVYEGDSQKCVDTLFCSKEKNEKIEVSFDKYMDLIECVLVQAPWNKLFDKSIVIKENIRFREDISLGEDIIFCLKYYTLCGSKSICCINRPLYNYYISETDSLNTKYYPNILEIDNIIYSELEKCIISWGADKEQMEKYYNNRFYRYETALANTYKKGNKSSSKEKRKTNSTILKSAEFKESLSKVTSRIHPIHKIAYKSESWILVKLAYTLTSIKNKIIKRK